MAGADSQQGSLLRWALGAAALLLALGSVGVVSGLRDTMTTYAVNSNLATVAELGTGLTLIAVGGLFVLERRTGSSGPVALLLGLVWLAPLWIGWENGPELARSLAMLAPPFFAPLALHFVVAFPIGNLDDWFKRFLIGFAYLLAGVVSIGRGVARDPFRDPFCWNNCTVNSFLIGSNTELVNLLDWLWLRGWIVVGLVAAVLAGWRLTHASAVARRALWPVLIASVLVNLTGTAYAAAVIWNPAENPLRQPYLAIFLSRAGSLIALSAALAWYLVGRWQRQSSVDALVKGLDETSSLGSLERALADSLGDADLLVAYWLPNSGRFVDAAGNEISPSSTREQVVTTIVRGGERVAALVHDRALYGAGGLAAEIGPAARLAIDNERLRAELLAQLADLKASRSRIVAAGDEARRRLERDLHDGAQQRLLAVVYEARMALTNAESTGNQELVDALTAGIAEGQAALAELRELAHGIFPVILDQAGLGPALTSIAEDAPIPVEIEEMPTQRFNPAIERAAFLMVASAIETSTSADEISVRLRRENSNLIIELSGVEESPSVHLKDRVGALGGEVEGRKGHLRVKIPCE